MVRAVTSMPRVRPSSQPIEPEAPPPGTGSQPAAPQGVSSRKSQGPMPQRRAAPPRRELSPGIHPENHPPASAEAVSLAALGKSAMQKRGIVNLATIADTREGLKDPGNWMPLLPGHDHHLIVASSEGGLKSTTDHDDPEGIRRLVQALRLLPKDKQAKTTFLAFVNTSQNAESGMSTKAAMLDLVEHLARKGIPREQIHLGLPPLDPKTGQPKPGIYVAYGAEARPKVPNEGEGLAGERKLSQLSIGEKTEVTALMLASPHGMSDLPKVHNLVVIGNGRNATNDNYGRPADPENGRPLSDSQALLQKQRHTLKGYVAEQRIPANERQARIGRLLEDRQVIFDFEAAHAESLTGTQRDRIFGKDAGLPDPEVQRISADTTAKVGQNTLHTLGLVKGCSPDGAYGNRAFVAGQEILGIAEDRFKAGLAAARKSTRERSDVKGPDFVKRPQLPGLVKYMADLQGQGLLNINHKAVQAKLARAQGADLLTADGAPDHEKLVQYTGSDGPTEHLAAAAAIHLGAIEKQKSLLFPGVADNGIPATEAAFKDMVNAAGGWRNSKVVEYDTLGTMKLLLPSADPANVACALDIPADVLAGARSKAGSQDRA